MVRLVSSHWGQLLFDPQALFQIIPYSLALCVSLFLAQVMSAGLAARYTGHFDTASSWMIGFGMLGRAELTFVVINMAYGQHHILTLEAFYTLMLTTFLFNISVPLTIRWWKSHFGKPVPEGS